MLNPPGTVQRKFQRPESGPEMNSCKVIDFSSISNTRHDNLLGNSGMIPAHWAKLMKTFTLLLFACFAWLQNSLAQQPPFVDCSCLATQSVLVTNACQAVIPDLCQFTNCWQSTVVPPPTLFCSQNPAAGTPVTPGLYPITVTISDSFGQATSCNVKFTVNGPGTGNFTLICATNKTVDCAAQWNFDPPTPVNYCCPPAGTPGNGVTVVVTTTTNGVCPRVYTRTWQATDSCNHTATCQQTVTVADTTPPSINIGQTQVTVTCGQGWGYTVPIVSDNCTPQAQLTVIAVSTSTNILCGQSYAGTRIWKVSDLCGNSTFATQVVTVVDFTPPVINCASNKTVGCGATWTFDQPNAYESCITGVGNSNVTITVYSTVTNSLSPLVVTRTWTATDGCGNSNQCSQTVSVSGGGVTLNCNALAGNPILRTNACRAVIPDLCPIAIAQAQQGCPGQFTCSQNPPAGTPVGPGSYPITITVTDANNNSSSCTVIFTVTAVNQTRAWNTGMGGVNGNIPLAPGTTDPNYTLVSFPTGGCSGPAQVQDPTSIPSPPWLTNGPNSQWIGPAFNTVNCIPGVYRYRLCFYLPCTEGASLRGQWTSDDWGGAYLNGLPTGNMVPSTQYPSNGFDILHPLIITNGFVCGMNCLDLYVTNASTWTGLRAQITNTFNDCCCGPAQTVLSAFSGMNANGPMPQGAPDNQVTLTCAPPGTSLTTAVVTQPSPFWMPNGPNSQWLGVSSPLSNEPDGVYCYTIRFTIPCPAGVNINANITGRWSGDDTGTIYLNGNPTGNTLPSTWAFTNWQAINISSGFVPGPNTLTFYVTNSGASPTGVRFELTGTASCCSCTNLCSVAITCPQTVTVQTCTSNAAVIYAPPTATSSCGAAVTIVCAPPSGSLFPAGTNAVTCTASDPMGNSATCSFSVIVRPDTTPPTIDCACLQQQVRPVRACSAVIPDLCQYKQCFSDNCPVAQLTCSQTPAAGTVVPAGLSYVITVTVTDAAGNSSQCQIGFSVIAPTDSRVWHTGGTGAQAANFFTIQTPSGPVNNPAVPTAPVTGYWVANDANSSWISFTNNSSQAARGVYVYRLAFTLPCTNGASIVGRFLADDSARIWLNGVPTANLVTSYSTWAPVSITSGFVSGLNTLDVYVTNAIIWTGFRAELTNLFNCCCPQALVLKCPKAQSGWFCGTAGSAQVPYTVSAYSQCPSSNVTVGVVCNPPSPGPFPAGTTIVHCTATDSLGNTTSCSFPVTVVKDVTAPVITCPANITIATCSNKVPAYYKATAKDDCSPTVTISCVPPSGSQFNAGTTNIVTCTATDACGNHSSCSFAVIIINNLLWQTLPAGIADCYSAAGSEPANPGPCLMTAYPGGYWKNFDVGTVDRKVGHTWNFPVSWNILAATFDTRARPPSPSCLGISGNDSISMGLTSCGSPAWLWSRYFGSGNPSAGLVSAQWCNGSGCNYNFNFNLAAMPPVSGPAINLLPHMNSVKRLDVFYQDDTTVDYATLRVQRCAPQAVLGGFDTALSNAQLVKGPFTWCLVTANPTLATWSASISIGGAPAVAQSMVYRCKPVEWDLKTATKARTAAGDQIDFARLSLSHASNSPVAELRLSTIPPGVTDVQVIVLDDGIPLTIDTHPADPSLVLASFSSDTEFYGSLFTRDEGFFDVSRVPGQAGNQICIRFLPEPEAVSFTSFEIEATGIPELDLGSPQVRSANKEHSITATGDAIALALDGNVSVSPLVPGSSAPVGLRWRRPQNLGSSGQDGVEIKLRSARDMTVYAQAVLLPPAAGAAREVRFTATGTYSDMTSRPLHTMKFAACSPGYCLSAELDGVAQPIHRVQVWSNAVLVADISNPASISCASLPPIYRATSSPWFVDADICHRFPFYNRETVRIEGVSYQCSELRVSLPSPSSDSTLEGLVGIDVDAAGADSLSLSQVIAGPVPLRFLPPIRSIADDGSGLLIDQIAIGWDQPWPALESAPSVTGPWTKVPTDGTEITVPAGNGVKAQFYRLKE